MTPGSTKYRGTAHVVVEVHPMASDSESYLDQRIICMWDSRRKAEQYITVRKENDARRGESHRYEVMPWLVQG